MNDVRNHDIVLILGLGAIAIIGIIFLSRIPTAEPPVTPTSEDSGLSVKAPSAPTPQTIASATPQGNPPASSTPSGFRGPTGAPHINGPSGPPPNY